jgi:archaellum biogenesis ATPase FlaH
MKFQTGIGVFDTYTGGIYPGLLLLVEEVGAGGREFAFTTIMNLIKSGKTSDIYYISMTLSDAEVKRELKLAFPDSEGDWIEKPRIISFAKEYFARTIVPLSWVTEEKVSLASLRPDEKLLEKLVNLFDRIPDRSILIIDSLTDLMRKTEIMGGDEIKWSDLVDFFTGIRKLIINKDMLVYVLLTKNVIEKSKEEEILNTANGVIFFEWNIEKDVIKRSMYIRKLTGSLPFLEKQKIMKYDVTIDPAEGFIISRLLRVI